MKFFQQPIYFFHGKIKSFNGAALPGLVRDKVAHLTPDTELPAKKLVRTRRRILVLLRFIKNIGVSPAMDDYERRKLGIFNLLNFFQIVTGLLVPAVGLFNQHHAPVMAWLLAPTPAFISIVVLWLNARRKQEAAMIAYFILYPVVTSVVFMSGLNLGVELFFILYGILSVFFLQQISHMLFSVALSMISYFILAVVWKEYRYQAEQDYLPFYLFNQLLAIVFIFYGLFLIKKENALYQKNILTKNREIAEKAALLKEQADKLSELNLLKNKLFSVIAHDLKSPMYALQTVFRNMQQYDLPAREMKKMLPDVVNDLTYTTGLMENLLQWAKSQMQSETIQPAPIDLSKTVTDVIFLLRLQAENKQLYIENKITEPLEVFADNNMVNLVLRNLLSNAIKFTPAQGYIEISAGIQSKHIEVLVKDSGEGISEADMQKISMNNYYTTKGTSNEPGTGLGLMLCKEFLTKSGSSLTIQSKPGEGSEFSFILPRQ